MARKVIFNMSNTLVATINKINQMSDWLGDLDDLNKRNYKGTRSYLGGFEDNEYTENGGLLINLQLLQLNGYIKNLQKPE